MSGNPESCHVTVDSRELAEAWATLKRTTVAKNRGELLVLYRDGELTFELGGAAIGVEADGKWVGQARLDSARIFALLPHLPKHGPLKVFRDGERIRIDTIGFRCKWDPQPTEGLRLPMNPTDTELLWVSQIWSRAEIEGAGLLSLLEKAERDRDTRVESAVALLAPFAVSEEDLLDLIRRRIFSRHDQ